MPSQTESEKYLAALCQRSFLSLWSYPNLYTDEGLAKNKGSGRELCDLLVVFGGNVLIFSDKHIRFKDTGRIDIDWPRWHRQAVMGSFKQLYGAESWLRRYPERVFLDASCTKRFPLPLPPVDRVKFHRIAVTRGSYDACHQFFGGKSIGSLRISTDPAAGSAGYFPFTTGIGSPEKPFIHVFDEHTLDIVFEHLDTVSDFVAYLTKKELFLGSASRTINVDGEEQLLGLYMKNMNWRGEHDLVLAEDIPLNVDIIVLSEGIWESIANAPQLKAKKKADRVSYAWDKLIEQFIQFSHPKTLGLDIALDPRDMEIALRIMASESRLNRRHLAFSFLDARRRSSPTKPYARVSAASDDTGYVFLAEPQPAAESYEDYRKFRVSRLLAYCKVAVLRLPNAKHIVGIACDSYDPARRGGSEDLIHLDVSSRTQELEEDARQVQQQFKILLDKNVHTIHIRGTEYPDSPRAGVRLEQDPSRGFVDGRGNRAAHKKQKHKKKIQDNSRRRNRVNKR